MAVRSDWVGIGNVDKTVFAPGKEALNERFLELSNMVWYEGIEKCFIQISVPCIYEIPLLEIL